MVCPPILLSIGFRNLVLLDLEKNLKIILYIYFIKIIDR